MRKVDILSKTCQIWHEEGCYTSEPIFLRNPSDETVGLRSKKILSVFSFVFSRMKRMEAY